MPATLVEDRVPTLRSVTPCQRRRAAAESAEHRRRSLAALGIGKRLRGCFGVCCGPQVQIGCCWSLFSIWFLYKHACCCSTCTHTSFCHTIQLASARPTMLSMHLPSLFGYKTGGGRIKLDRDELPCPLILRHLANVSLSVLDNINKHSIGHDTWQTLCQSNALPSKHEELYSALAQRPFFK